MSCHDSVAGFPFLFNTDPQFINRLEMNSFPGGFSNLISGCPGGFALYIISNIPKHVGFF